MVQYPNIQKIAFILIVFFTLSTCFIFSQEAQKPNIIFLMSDDHRADAVGYKGNADVLTPNIDKLAEKGIIFNRHYASSPICMNSRATTMTGMPEYMTGTGFHHGGMMREIWNQSYVAKLKEAGYKTGFAGKFGFGVFDTEKDAGTENINAWKSETSKPIADFNKWWGFNGGGNYLTHKNKYLEHLADSSYHVSKILGYVGQEFIKDYANQDDPFCLTVWFKSPHKPFQPDSTYDYLFKGREYSYPENYGRKGGAHFSWQALSGRQYDQFTDHWAPDSNYQENIRMYYQLIYGMDVAIGMIVEELKKQGIADNTIIIYSSDNGYFTGSHGFQGKTLGYEDAAQIPMVVYDPRNENMNQNLEVNSITSNEDIAPTLMDFAGLTIPTNITGKSLFPLLENPESSIRSSLPLVNVFRDNDACQAISVVTEEYKYIYWGYETLDSVPFPNDSSITIKYEAAEELYDLTIDQSEMNNLATDSTQLAVLCQLREIYDSYLDHWVANCVQRNGYPDYDTLFKRKFGFDTVPGTIPPIDTTPSVDTIPPVDTIPTDTTQGGKTNQYNTTNTNSAITIYPNPARQYLRISGVSPSCVTVKIYTIGGNLVYHSGNVLNSEILIDLVGIHDGIYVMQIIDTEANIPLKNEILRIIKRE